MSLEGGGPVPELPAPDEGLVVSGLERLCEALDHITILLGYGAPAVTIDRRGNTTFPPFSGVGSSGSPSIGVIL